MFKVQNGQHRIVRIRHKAIMLVAFVEAVFFLSVWWIMVFTTDDRSPLDRLIKSEHPEVFVSLFIGLVVLAGYLVYRIVSRFFSPVADLIRVAEQITEGDIAARGDVQSGDELQELSERFNSMVDSMRAELANLGQKVRSKATKLEGVRAEEFNSLKDITEFKNEIMTATSHEFRTPLSGIRWNLNAAMVEDGLSDGAKSNIRNALDACEQLTEVVNVLMKQVNGGRPNPAPPPQSPELKDS